MPTERVASAKHLALAITPGSLQAHLTQKEKGMHVLRRARTFVRAKGKRHFAPRRAGNGHARAADWTGPVVMLDELSHKIDLRIRIKPES